MESQPQNPEFRNNPENFHPCDTEMENSSSVIQDFVFLCQKMVVSRGIFYKYIIIKMFIKYNFCVV